MAATKRFPKPVLAAIHGSAILWLRAGDEHKFTGVWPIVIGDRVFVRSWNDKPTGWHQAFLTEPRGAIRIGERVVRIRAWMVTSERIMDDVERGYADKYRTPASRKYVRGFRLARRRRTTTELRPA